jgi:3alpha(or 20beta)-hydroxysteroid dehydrogenase
MKGAGPVRDDDYWSQATVVVTGAGRGQGAAEAARFVEVGATVLLADVDRESVAEHAARLGDRAHPVHLDVTSETDWAGLVTRLEGLPPVRVLVNNAGVHWFTALVDEPAERLEQMLRVNVVGCQLGIRHLAAPMRDAGGGSIINICSVLAERGSRNASSYVTSKWALRGLTKAAAMELGAWGIRVNAVHPGYIDTPMLAAAAGGSRPADYYDYLPLGRAGTTDEVAELVLFLASSRSSYLTGADFAVDGGMLAGSGPR